MSSCTPWYATEALSCQYWAHDKGRHVTYCEWLLDMVERGFMDPFLFFSTDEAWFHLSGYVNAQNTWHWSSENPHEFWPRPLHDLKIGVWCAVSGNRIVGPIFFEENVNTQMFICVFSTSLWYSRLQTKCTMPSSSETEQHAICLLCHLPEYTVYSLRKGLSAQMCGKLALQTYRLVILTSGVL